MKMTVAEALARLEAHGDERVRARNRRLSAEPATQWTMNNALAAIGIHHAEHRARAVAIGEALGVYRAYPVSEGCTSPFAPIWIGEMVRRQGGGRPRTRRLVPHRAGAPTRRPGEETLRMMRFVIGPDVAPRVDGEGYGPCTD
jgi:hypothetical protein